VVDGMPPTRHSVSTGARDGNAAAAGCSMMVMVVVA